MKKITLFLAVLLGLLAPTCAVAQEGNFKLSLWDKASFAIPNANTRYIKGLDLGIGSTAHKVTGVQADIIWAETADLTGVSFAWGISKIGYGKGVQWAAVNMNNDLTGVQLGGVNLSYREMVGLQLGLYNQAEYVNGLQFGLINYARHIYGLQLGIFNIAENGVLPAMIFINGRF